MRRLKTSLLAVGLGVSAMSSAAHAALQTTGTFGVWETTAGTDDTRGLQMCVAQIQISGSQVDSYRYFGMKYQTRLILVFGKSSWLIPNDRPISIQVQVDQAETWTLHGIGDTWQDTDGTYLSSIKVPFDMTEVDQETGELS
jgi:hypothetical protein